MYSDQHVLFGNLFGGVPLRREHILELSLDAMHLRHASGGAENRTILGAGVDYVQPHFSVGAAYSIRFADNTDAMPAHDDRTDQIFELVARAPITGGW